MPIFASMSHEQEEAKAGSRAVSGVWGCVGPWRMIKQKLRPFLRVAL